MDRFLVPAVRRNVATESASSVSSFGQRSPALPKRSFHEAFDESSIAMEHDIEDDKSVDSSVEQVVDDESKGEIEGSSKGGRKRPRCEECTREPNFADEGQKARFCSTHKKEGMVNVRAPRCRETGCMVANPSFAEPGAKRGRFCRTHKKDGMVDVAHRRCEHEGCQRINPSFAEPGAKHGRYCTTHKGEGMIDVRSKRCEETGCESLNPSFAYQGAKCGRFCDVHKKEGMVNVASPKCAEDGCEKQRSFAEPGAKRARFCDTHKEAGMINVVARRCEVDDCQMIPLFAEPGAERARFCGPHKKEGMVNVRSKRCEESGCEKEPVFGDPGTKQGRFCDTHKEAGMINVRTKLCPHGRQRQSCPKCSNLTCNMANCTKPAGHQFAGATSFLQHMRSIHGGDPKARTKTKELEVHEVLQRAGVEFDYQVRVPFVSCGLNSETKYAILDFVIYLQWGILCLEVDENQHLDRDPSCDPRRDFDVAASNSLGNDQSLVVLRYNPDAYKVGMRTIRTSKRERHARLISAILGVTYTCFRRYFLYFDRDSVDSELPSVACRWDAAARECAAVLK